MQAMTFNEANEDLAQAIERVNVDHEPLVITHETQKPVVMMSLADFNAWQETAYLLSSKANAEDLLQAVEEIARVKNLVRHDLIETP